MVFYFPVLKEAKMWIIDLFKKRESPPIQVPQQKPRYACPFYGFHETSKAFIDQKGNQCALERDYTPCTLEMRGEIPDWNSCTIFNHPGNHVEIASLWDRVVFPSEFKRVDQKKWKGIPFKDWMDYVMNPQRLRPH